MRTAFTDFRIIRAVFTPEECDRILDDVRARDVDRPEERRLVTTPGMTYTTTDNEPAWATQRVVTIADALDSTFWHVNLGQYPRASFFRLGPGAFMAPHDDRYEYGNNPGAVMLTYLSGPDDYDGGELMVYGIAETIRPERGSVVILPTDLAHAVAPVRSGERWMMSKVFGARRAKPTDELERLGAGAATTTAELAESFAFAAWAVGWNTTPQSIGRCHFIAASWGRRLYDAGVPYEMVRYEDPDPIHPGDRYVNLVRTGDVLWDWASRGSRKPDAAEQPWPLVTTEDHYLDRGMTQLSVCSSCGQSDHTNTGTCAPPLTPPTVATGERRQAPS